LFKNPGEFKHKDIIRALMHLVKADFIIAKIHKLGSATTFWAPSGLVVIQEKYITLFHAFTNLVQSLAIPLIRRVSMENT
jgi:hypothetical protein